MSLLTYYEDDDVIESNTEASVRLTFRQQVAWLNDQRLTATLNTTTIDRDLLHQGRNFTLYLSIPPGDMNTHTPFMRLILSDILTTMLKREHPPQQNTLIMLDEAALLGTMSEIRLAFTTLRSYGIQLWTIWQDPGQIQALYSDWTTLIANTHTVT